MAHAGVASRRHSEELIQAGRVSVNGRVVTELGTRVRPGERVEVDGKPLAAPEHMVYIVLNKPRSVMTTLYDPQGRPTVLDLIQAVSERVYPVGRLDFDTEGVLLLTNDGTLSHALAHPARLVKKTYLARVRGVPTAGDIARLQAGVELDDGPTAPAEARILSSADGLAVVSLTIHEGRNRQVRRMFEAIGREVIGLRRIRLGNLDTKGLAPGQWRELTVAEVRDLYHHAGLRWQGDGAVGGPAPEDRGRGPVKTQPTLRRSPRVAAAAPDAAHWTAKLKGPRRSAGAGTDGRASRAATGPRRPAAGPAPGGPPARAAAGRSAQVRRGSQRDALPPGPLGDEIRTALARLKGPGSDGGGGTERPARRPPSKGKAAGRSPTPPGGPGSQRRRPGAAKD